MSTSDWYTRNAHWIIVILLMTVLSIAGYFVLINTGYNQGYKEAQATRSRAEAYRELHKDCLGGVFSEKTFDCLETKIITTRADERAEEDLQAQRDMANWALAAFVAALIIGTLSVAVTGVGVVFVRDTLRANTGMWREARRAANISQQQLASSQRPWLALDVKLDSDCGSSTVRVGFR